LQIHVDKEKNMSRLASRTLTLVVVLVGGLLGQSLLATTVVVGPATCQPTLVHFSTIHAAVSAVPFNTTVLVCPGVYPEQVIITQPLTLKGITDGTGNAAIITVPLAGLVQNATSSLTGPVATQLLVANTVGVTVQDIAIDGTGAGCVAGANRVFGIEYYFVGTPVDGVSAGKIQNVVVRNENSPCTIGDGIEIDNSFVTVMSNEVHDISITPIGVLAGEASITSNTTQNALNGIVIQGTGAATVVSNNTSSNLTPNFGFTQVGIWVNGGAATVSKNTVTAAPGAWGIYLPSTGAGTKVTGNQVSTVFYGVYMTGASATVVQSNSINSASSDGIVDVFSAGGNIVTKNTVNEEPFGIFHDGSTGGDTLTPNSFFNVITTIDPNPFNNGSTTSAY
jgi:parallel beta-helix repeat protein